VQTQVTDLIPLIKQLLNHVRFLLMRVRNGLWRFVPVFVVLKNLC